jgi:hypothetical protein
MTNFHYESNACCGWCETVAGIVEKAKLQIEDINGIYTVDNFLDFSMVHPDHPHCFGTISEYKGPQTLRQFLEEEQILIEVLKSLS